MEALLDGAPVDLVGQVGEADVAVQLFGAPRRAALSLSVGVVGAPPRRLGRRRLLGRRHRRLTIALRRQLPGEDQQSETAAEHTAEDTALRAAMPVLFSTPSEEHFFAREQAHGLLRFDCLLCGLGQS